MAWVIPWVEPENKRFLLPIWPFPLPRLVTAKGPLKE